MKRRPKNCLRFSAKDRCIKWGFPYRVARATDLVSIAQGVREGNEKKYKR